MLCSLLPKFGGNLDRMDIFSKFKDFKVARQLEEAGVYPYFKVIQNAEGGTVYIDGKRKVMAGSNNYLGLTHHPKVRSAAKDAIEKYGTGCSGSRFLNGTIDLHIELEKRLAHFMGKEAALVYSTGFQTNLGTISCLTDENDLIFSDEENHASIIEGTRLAEGETIVFKHNDMKDLEAKLKEHQDVKGKIVITDGVYSMTGDIAPLDQIVKISKKYNARIMLDDAHGIGVLGKNGKGTADHFNVTNDIDIIMGTFSKSFASLGGFIVATEEVIHYIKHKSRAFIFSAAMPPASLATVLSVLDILEESDEHVQRLWKITHKMQKGFQSMGYDTSPSKTPIIPINIGDEARTFFFAKAIYDAGVFTNPVVAPGVPPGQGIIRTSYMASHTDQELNLILDTFHTIGKMCEMIK